jgi:hypothetical protein
MMGRPVCPPDYSSLSFDELLQEGIDMHDRLQLAWHCELQLPAPDWVILEELSKQLKMLEEGLAAYQVLS